jgi:hypothetical protein
LKERNIGTNAMETIKKEATISKEILRESQKSFFDELNEIHDWYEDMNRLSEQVDEKNIQYNISQHLFDKVVYW